jgi:hypothetical protein
VEKTRNSIQNFVQKTANSVSHRGYGFRVGLSIHIGEGCRMAKNGSEYVIIAGYFDGNSVFMKAENLFHVLIPYLPM